MFKQSNALDDPALVSRSDYLPKGGKSDRIYQYQTPAQSRGETNVQHVPENVKHLLRGMKPKHV